MEKEFDDISPLLKELKRKSPTGGFAVPENYFKVLSDDILRQAKAEDDLLGHPLRRSEKIKPLTWEQQFLERIALVFRPRLATALLVFGVLTGVVMWVAKREIVQTPVLAQSEIQQYINENIDDFEDDIILEFGENTFPSAETVPQIQLQNDELEHYLDEILKDEDVDDLL